MDDSALYVSVASAAIFLVALLLYVRNWVANLERSMRQTRGNPAGAFEWIAIKTIGRRRSKDSGLIVPAGPDDADGARLSDDEDRVAKDLMAFDPRIKPPPPLTLPEPPRAPEARPGRPATAFSIDSINIERLNAIALSKSPFQFADAERRDLSATQLLPPIAELPPPPERPSQVAVEVPRPSLNLPYYFKGKEPSSAGGLLARPLNRVVDAAHADVVDRYNQIQLSATRLTDANRRINNRRKVEYEAALERLKNAAEWRERVLREREERYARWKGEFNRLVAEYQLRLQSIERALREQDTDTIAWYFDVIVSHIALPAAFPQEWRLKYDKPTRILVIDHAAPDVGALEYTHAVRLKREVATRPVPKRERKRLEGIAIEGLALFMAIAVAKSDVFENVDAIAENLWVDYLDKRTGLERRTYVASLFATKGQLLHINPANIDTHLCFRSLKGKYVAGLEEYEAVEPIVRLDTADDRIVDPREVLGGLVAGENLAAMDWEDFEHLVRELFEKEFCPNGSTVEITRASRDRGVDAIIFDPDPLRGGKYVIQAKRYTIPVDVAAVRELYGTVVNEGAMKGILVTTSSFGPDAYSFAKDKPLKLIPGPELLGLFQRHGYHFRIDISEARRQMQ